MIRTSYSNCDLNYGNIIAGITIAINPKKIVEIGILDGYSLNTFIENSSPQTEIYAYDLFDKFIGNHSDKDFLKARFKTFKNVNIEFGDFYELHKNIDNIDILHIDIANNGDVLEFVIQNYLQKLSKNGIILFEGGSHERDNVPWMNTYQKPKIEPIIKKYNSNELCIKVIGTFPSLTLIKRYN